MTATRKIVIPIAVSLICGFTQASGADSAVTRDSADAAYAANQFSRAASEYRRLLHDNSNDTEIRMGLASAYELTGRADDAKREAEQVLRDDSRNVDALLLLGRINGREEDWAKAKTYYERAVSADANSALAHFGLGEFYQANGDMVKAEEHYSTYHSLIRE